MLIFDFPTFRLSAVQTDKCYFFIVRHYYSGVSLPNKRNPIKLGRLDPELLQFFKKVEFPTQKRIGLKILDFNSFPITPETSAFI